MPLYKELKECFFCKDYPNCEGCLFHWVMELEKEAKEPKKEDATAPSSILEA